MRIHLGFLSTLFVCMLISCAVLPPEKPFTTELWQIDVSGCMKPEPLDTDCVIRRINDEGVEVSIKIESLDIKVWTVLKIKHIKAEWDYEDLLKKSCEVWR